TQNQALNALVFLYREVLESPLGKMQAFVRAKRPKNLPIVLTKAEVQSVLKHVEGVPPADRPPVVWVRSSIAGVFDSAGERSGFRANGNTGSPRQGRKG